jgi:hypothetical protein
MTDPKALKIIRKSLKNRDARTCLLGAEILGRATGQNPLDILIKQLRDAETKIADQVSQAVMLMMSDASTAATFLGKNSSVPEKHRKLLLRHAETRILFGSRTPESWRSRTDYYIFDNEEITDVLSSLISDAGSLHFVDWRGLAEESIEPATAINMRLKKVEINEAWNRLLFEHLRGSKIDSIAIGDIMIISTRDRLGTIARVLSTRPVVGRKTLKKNRAAAKLLQVSVSKLDFEDTKLSQVLQFLRDVSGAKIKMDFNSLVPLGVDPNTPVNMHASDLTLETSLKLMLINIVEPGVLTYKIDDGQIHIVKAPEAPAAPELDPVKVLTGALKHSDKAVRDAAAAALKELRK